MDENKLLEQRIREIANDIYDERALKSKYNVSQVPYHTHNGTDSVPINEKDVIHNIRNYTRLMNDSSEEFSILSIANVNRLTLKGFAANNAGGGAATKRAIINGEAYFGRCYTFTGTAPVINTTTSANGIPFIQSSNSMYTDLSGMTPAIRVSVAPFLALTTDGSSNIIVVNIVSYNNGRIDFETSIASGWLLQVDLILS